MKNKLDSKGGKEETTWEAMEMVQMRDGGDLSQW